jgi:ferredoxin--NADP+ reductase
MPKPVPMNATIVGRDDLSETLAVFRIRPDLVPTDDQAWFDAGQYVTLGLNAPGPEGPSAVLRPYSIASEPGERRWLEFYIRRTADPESDTPFTHLLWPLGVGARLHLGGKVTGRFTLAHTVGDDDPRLKVFVAAGTGLAPFVSIVRDALKAGRPDALRRFAILHGASRPQELGYKADLERAMDHLALRYFPTVSRATQVPDWTGDKGRVETFFDGEKLVDLERRLGLPVGGLAPKYAVVYVCGFTGTIAGTVTRLIRRGFVPDAPRMRRLLEIPEGTKASLFFEQYDTEPLIDPTNDALLERLRKEFREARR